MSIGDLLAADEPARYISVLVEDQDLRDRGTLGDEFEQRLPFPQPERNLSLWRGAKLIGSSPSSGNSVLRPTPRLPVTEVLPSCG